VNGAQLRLSSPTLAINREVTADDAVSYQFAAIPAGVYSLIVSHPGFSSRVLEGLDVTCNRNLTFNVLLELGKI